MNRSDVHREDPFIRMRLNRKINHLPAVSPRPRHLARVPTGPELLEERRARESGGPQDNATYHCSCGYVFAESVSTSVSCPHCGTGQAW